MGKLLKQLEMLQLNGQLDGTSSSAACTPETATSNFSNGYLNQLMQVEIDDLDESPPLMPFDADQAMTDEGAVFGQGDQVGPSEVEKMQALLMRQFFESQLHRNDTLAKTVLRQQMAS